MATATIYYMVLIQTAPNCQFQPIVGWDSAHTDKKDAHASAKRAEKLFHAAKVVSETEERAKELGWLD